MIDVIIEIYIIFIVYVRYVVLLENSFFLIYKLFYSFLFYEI